MARLEDLQPGAAIRGILPDQLVNAVPVNWFGGAALELTYKGASGKLGNELLYRSDEPRLEIVEQGRPWSFDGDGANFRLVSEALRIRLAHLFDPVLAVHTSRVDPLPHQITGVYEAMLPRQPLRFLLADDPGAGKTIMAGLLIKELMARGDLKRCLIVCPGGLAEQWQDELDRRFQLPFQIKTNDNLEAARTGNWFRENDLAIARLDKLSRNEDVQQQLQAPDCGWDLVVCDEAQIAELNDRLRRELKNKGDFDAVHPLPVTSGDVADGLETRLVVLGVDNPFSRDAGNMAEPMARTIFESYGSASRQYRNGIVFLAADKIRLQDLDAAVRRYLAWNSIVAERETLQLTPHQAKQAETQRVASDGDVQARLPETYNCLLVPSQTKEANAPVQWQAITLKGGGSLAERASKKLKADDALLEKLGPSMLRREMDGVPLWRANHVAIRQIVKDFASYLYLPRLRNPGVLTNAVQAGIGLLTWEKDAFAYADSFDEHAGRYRGLRATASIMITADDPGLLVKPEVARAQMDREAAAASRAAADASSPTQPGPEDSTGASATGRDGAQGAPRTETEPKRMRRYHGSVELDPTRVGRDASQIATEVISHLASLLGSSVRVTLEIEANIRDGAPENVVRTVTENGRTLKFGSNSGFETE